MFKSLQLLRPHKFSSAELRLKLLNTSCLSELSTFYLHVAFTLQVRTTLTLMDQAVSWCPQHRPSPSLKCTTKPQYLSAGISDMLGTKAWLPLPHMAPLLSLLTKK